MVKVQLVDPHSLDLILLRVTLHHERQGVGMTCLTLGTRLHVQLLDCKARGLVSHIVVDVNNCVSNMSNHSAGQRDDMNPFRNAAEEADLFHQGSGFEASDKLAELFRPPYSLMSSGSLDHNRQKAMSQGKWLIVNVQDPSEFQCQILNRDLWKDKEVQDFVRKNFVFIQVSTG